ncbi:unnamed protein product, partial [Heterosigma akashiwo]
VYVGVLPDNVKFSPDGTKVLIANEAEPSEGDDDADGILQPSDAVGSITLVEGNGDWSDASSWTTTTMNFTSFNSEEASLLEDGFHRHSYQREIGSGSWYSLEHDLEPEFVTWSSDGTTAYVSIQENNAIATVDIASATISALSPLPLIEAGSIDTSKDDAPDGSGDWAINRRDWGSGLRKLSQPDSIFYFEIDGTGYIATANEGDYLKTGDFTSAFDESLVTNLIGDGVKLGDISDRASTDLVATLNGTSGLIGSSFDDDRNLGDFYVSQFCGCADTTEYATVNTTAADEEEVTGGCTSYDYFCGYGGRGFSIYAVDDLEDIEDPVVDVNIESLLETYYPDIFNLGVDDGEDPMEIEDRTEKKGSEPESVYVSAIGNKTYLFLGVERTSIVMYWDISTPSSPVYQGAVDSGYNATAFAANYAAGDEDGAVAAFPTYVDPEALQVVGAGDSFTGNALLVQSSAITGYVLFSELEQTCD